MPFGQVSRGDTVINLSATIHCHVTRKTLSSGNLRQCPPPSYRLPTPTATLGGRDGERAPPFALGRDSRRSRFGPATCERVGQHVTIGMATENAATRLKDLPPALEAAARRRRPCAAGSPIRPPGRTDQSHRPVYMTDLHEPLEFWHVDVPVDGWVYTPLWYPECSFTVCMPTEWLHRESEVACRRNGRIDRGACVTAAVTANPKGTPSRKLHSWAEGRALD